MSALPARVRATALAGAIAAGCTPAEPVSGSPAPVNACPQFPCSEYDAGPSLACGSDGTCAEPMPPQGIVLVVSVPQDSLFAPGLQYVVPFEHLSDCSPPQVCTCAWPACGHLPAYATISGGYLMEPCAQSVCAGSGVGFFLGNVDSAGGVQETWLPVQATFRMLYDPWQDDVTALGLPLQPVEAVLTRNEGTPDPGPYGGPAYEYQVNLPLSATFERTVTPEAPYGSVFGPEVAYDLVNGSRFESLTVSGFDTTQEISPTLVPGGTLPDFDVYLREPQANPSLSMDGWTAFLRDHTTKRPISNVRALGGIDAGVQLVTNHLLDTASGSLPDALTNAELVIAPPLGAPYPVAVVYNKAEFPSDEPYPALPEPVEVTGFVKGPDGSGADADVWFEALAFLDDGCFNDTPYEFTGYAAASGASGGAYAVTLPQAPYRVDVRPRDGSVGALVTTITADAAHAVQSFALTAAPTLSGRATLSDGRPLAGATVETLPASCPVPAAPPIPCGALKALADTSSCLPRPQRTVTDADGVFSVPADPGGNRLTVEPATGTGFPWTVQTLEVGSASLAKNVVVPPPMRASFKLVGADGSAIAYAVVQAFYATGSPPYSSPAIEIGETLTDASGQCELLLALPR